MFGLFKHKQGLSVSLKVPGNYFETTSLQLKVQVTLSSPEQTTIEKLIVRLRADATKGHSAGRYIGEADLPRALTLAPGKPGSLEFSVPIDFSPIDDFDIPPENMALASAELKAAAAANRTENYRYSVEAVYKANGESEIVVRQPVRLVQPNEVRAG